MRPHTAATATPLVIQEALFGQAGIIATHSLGELVEAAACSRQLATWTAQLSRTGSMNARLPAQGSLALQAASVWLRMAGTAIQTGQLQQPPTVSGHGLLAAMPPDIPPPRRPPAGEEPVPDLCDGITITAERLRHAVRAVAAQGRWSPAAISASWRRGALASAITSHASELILRTLAERASQLGTVPSLHAPLASSADALGLAWPAWRSIVRHWDTTSTGIHQGPDSSPVAAELSDLVLRTGRLAYRNPRWTPACTDASPARHPSDLAGLLRHTAALHARLSPAGQRTAHRLRLSDRRQPARRGNPRQARSHHGRSEHRAGSCPPLV